MIPAVLGRESFTEGVHSDLDTSNLFCPLYSCFIKIVKLLKSKF